MSISILSPNNFRKLFLHLTHATSLALLTHLVILCSSTIVQSRPGDLDPAFGNAGKALNFVDGGIVSTKDVAIQPDGKLVVLCSLDNEVSQNFGLLRYNPNGTLDTTFSGDGIMVTAFVPFMFQVFGFAHTVELQTDGKIVVGGQVFDVGTGLSTFALARFNSNGSLDTSFGTNGKVITDIENDPYNAIKDILITQENEIIAIGTGCSRFDGEGNFFTFGTTLAKYQSDGTLDQTFREGGKLCTDLHPARVEVTRAAFEPDTNKIIVGSNTGLVRYLSSGDLDQSFGDGGIVSAVCGSGFSIDLGFTLQEDGKILIGGSGPDGRSGKLCRYEASGSLDTGFGTGGTIIVSNPVFGSVHISSINVQPDGKIVVGGTANTSIFAIVRYTSSGALDVSFGEGGYVFTTFPNFGILSDSLLQPDGKIVAVGTSFDEDVNRVGVVRYLGSDIEPETDIQVTASAPQSVLQHETITYFFRVTNNGPLTANNITLFDRIPGSTSFVSATPSSGTCRGTRNITCSLGNLQPGQSRTLNIVVRANATRVVANTAQISTISPENDLLNNTVTSNVTVSSVLLSLTPNIVYTGCSNTTLLRVRLANRAPATGALVSLNSSNPAVATVPSNIVVPAGETSAEINIQVASVISQTRVTITARRQADEFKQDLTARPGNGVQELSYIPNPVIGGSAVTFRVNLVCVATSDQQVIITSSNPSVATPAVSSITISQGAQTGSFAVTTSNVSTVQYPVITVRVNNVRSNVAMRILP